MYKYATVLGTASACKWMDKHMKKPLFGLLEKADFCAKSDEPRFNHTQANRELMKALYTGSLKGLYQENHDVVSDECFGDWMDETWTILHGLHKKLHEDELWEIDMNEWKNAGARVIDDIYKLNDVCKFEKVGDDWKHFCLENPGQCKYMEGLEDRLFDNMFELMGVAFDFYKLFMKDDSCYTDKEIMGEVYRASADYGETVAYLWGVDFKWDQAVQKKHIKRSVFHKQFHKELKEDFGKMTHMEKLALMFPDFADLFKGIEEFFKEINKTTLAMFHPAAHHHHKPAAIDGKVEPQQHHNMFSSMFGQPQHHQNFDLFGSLFPHPQPKAPVHKAMEVPQTTPMMPQHPEQIQFQDPFKTLFGHQVPMPVSIQKKPQFNFFEQPVHYVRQWFA